MQLPQAQDMTPERWARIVHIYESALATDSAAQAAFVAESTRDDESLRQEVESLLAQDGTPVLIDHPILEAAAVVLEPEATLAPNTSLGPYRIEALIGAGGMGQVYRARDTKLNRDVALKILPDAFVHDGDRVARFAREAQVLASLNHPNIGAIHGFEDSGPVHALVLELVEGPTLADRIARGPIPVEEALPIARQIAEALEAAHEHGIVHRDLKPANIKVRDDGTVKVLDFGLAKPASESAPTSFSQSPTVLSPAMTAMGVILGTAAYMSPEQAKGSVADRRSDVFSFGCVLYEMLTGRQPFQGETVADVAAAVLAAQPDLQALPPNLTPRLVDLLRRCLDKSPKKRWQAAGDLRIELETVGAAPFAVAPSAPLAPQRPLWRRVTPIVATAIAASVLAGAAVWSTARRTGGSAPPIVTRFAIPLDAGEGFTNTGRQVVAISPDGTQLVYVANRRLHVRSMADLRARTIPGTEGMPAMANPVFSPDGGSIAFFSTDQTLKKIDIRSGAMVTLCRTAAIFGMSWGTRGIVFGQAGSGVMRISPSGGNPERLVAVEENEVAHGPQILPDENSVLFTLGPDPDDVTGDRWNKARIVVHSLRSGQRKVLINGGTDARYLPTGHIVYAVTGVLYAVPFDLPRLEVVGAPVPIVEGVRRASGVNVGAAAGTVQFGVSDNGSLVYVPGPVAVAAPLDLALVDRDGAITPLKAPPRAYGFPRISPDGRKVAVGTDDGKEAILWIRALTDTSSSMRQLTFAGRNRFPVWSPDGEWIAFQSDRDGDLGIFRQRADGTGVAERLTKADPDTSHVPESWSPNGRHLLLSVTKGAIVIGSRASASYANVSLQVYSFESRTSAPFGAVNSSTLLQSAFSPDGRWVAYSSNASGRLDVYVEPFPSTGAKYRVTDSGRSRNPVWSPDGKALFYRPSTAQMAMVAAAFQPIVRFGTPSMLPRPFVEFGPENPRNYDITPDGKQFLALVEVDQDESGDVAGPRINVVLNWFEELKQRVPTR